MGGLVVLPAVVETRSERDWGMGEGRAVVRERRGAMRRRVDFIVDGCVR